jgi:hypothetical protein
LHKLTCITDWIPLTISKNNNCGPASLVIGRLARNLHSQHVFAATAELLFGRQLSADVLLHAALYIWRQLEAAGRVPNEDDEIMEQLFQEHRTLVTDYRRDQGDMNADDDLGYAGNRGQWVGNDTILASAAVVGEGVAAVRDLETHEFPSPNDVVANNWRMRWSGTHYDVDVAASVVPACRPAWIFTASGGGDDDSGDDDSGNDDDSVDDLNVYDMEVFCVNSKYQINT